MVTDKDVITIEHTITISRLITGSNLIALPGKHGQFLGEMGSVNDSNKIPQATATLITDFLKSDNK